MPHVESATVMVGVGAGSRCEEKRVCGLFHFLEHMAFKGTKKRPSAIKISSEIDSIGGELNAATDKEITLFYVKTAANYLELSFDVLSDILTSSLFKEEEIEREKGVIIEEINMYEDTPVRRVVDLFLRVLYGDNPMGWDIAGMKESVRAIKREDFLNYQRKFYFAKNMVLVVSGRTEEKLIKRLADKYFGVLPEEGDKEIKEIRLSQTQPKVKIVAKKTEQAHFCLGVPGFWYSHPDRFVLSVLASVLGGGMSSRLFIQIRERRGLAYYIYCQPEFYVDSGFLMARAGVRIEKIEEAIKIILEEFSNLKKKEVSQRELNKAKEYLKGNLILSLEDSRQVAERYLVQFLLEGKLRTPKEIIEMIDKVSAEDIQRVANLLFRRENFNLAIIGPYFEEKKFFEILK